MNELLLITGHNDAIRVFCLKGPHHQGDEHASKSICEADFAERKYKLHEPSEQLVVAVTSNIAEG